MTGIRVDIGAAYRGRRVLLTGHTGFKGGWLALWLKRLGAEVAGVALPAMDAPSLFASVDGEAIVDQHTLADIRDLGRLRAIFVDFEPEIVFHLAAQALVRPSYTDPAGTVATNVAGTANVLECVRITPSLQAVVIVTSDKCYENREWLWGYREIDRLGGHDPYAASKAAAEIVVEAFRRSFFAPTGRVGCATARAGNVIGGGDWAPERLIPDCVRALSRGARVQVRHPAAVRPWQHVLEPLWGYLLLGARLLAQPERFSSAWNFGPDAEGIVTVGALVEQFIKAWGAGAWEEANPAPENAPHEAHTLRLDCEKARRELAWRPRWHLERAVDEAAAWYREWNGGAGTSARILCERQIDAYERSSARG
jgi:CDP-glucose 4,6-dehydratase